MKKPRRGLTHRWLSTSTPGCMDARGVRATWGVARGLSTFHHVPRACIGNQDRAHFHIFLQHCKSLIQSEDRAAGAPLSPVSGIWFVCLIVDDVDGELRFRKIETTWRYSEEVLLGISRVSATVLCWAYPFLQRICVSAREAHFILLGRHGAWQRASAKSEARRDLLRHPRFDLDGTCVVDLFWTCVIFLRNGWECIWCLLVFTCANVVAVSCHVYCMILHAGTYIYDLIPPRHNM